MNSIGYDFRGGERTVQPLWRGRNLWCDRLVSSAVYQIL